VHITAARHAIKSDCGVGVAAFGNTCFIILIWLVILSARVAIIFPEENKGDAKSYVT